MRKHWLANLWMQRPARASARAPLKGLTDNPAYQWWRDPTILQPDSWWGAAQTETTLGEQARLMNELGVRLFRFELPWRAIAPERPGGARYDASAASDPGWHGYRWERLDLIVRLAEEAGLLPVPQVVFAPEWSTGIPTTRSAGATAPPGAPEHLPDLLRALVSRYRGRVRYWELWNEPDHPHSWSGSLRSYVELVLRPGAAAIRAADPASTVLLGGLADQRNLEAIYAAGGASCFDVVNFHIYPTRPGVGQVLRALRQARATMRAWCDASKPIWITECGIATAPPVPPSPFGGVTSEARQARFIRALYRAVDVEAVCFYQLRDTIIFDASGQPLKRVYWGLVSRDLQRRKPGFEAYRQSAALQRYGSETP
jgi:hypothetical protein